MLALRFFGGVYRACSLAVNVLNMPGVAPAPAKMDRSKLSNAVKTASKEVFSKAFKETVLIDWKKGMAMLVKLDGDDKKALYDLMLEENSARAYRSQPGSSCGICLCKFCSSFEGDNGYPSGGGGGEAG